MKRIPVVLLLMFVVLVACVVPQLQAPGGIQPAPSFPGLDALLRSDPPITTSLTDAKTEIPFLDGFNPTGFVSMIALPRAPNNGFLLSPGLFRFDAQSYCLNAGSYAPSKGKGYLYAPLKGPQADIIQNLLRRSVNYPEIAQHDIQALIWAILARTKLSDMPPNMLQTATVLLTPEEVLRVNGGALGLIPEKLLEQVIANLPPLMQQVLEAESRLRSLLTQAETTYEELEQVAVLFGVAPPGEGSREVPEGRWSYHPDGYFVRYFPSGYSQTLIQLYSPETFTLTRDTPGRIAGITDPLGNRIETDYAGATSTSDPAVRAQPFRSIRLTRVLIVPPELVIEFKSEWKNLGWTLSGAPTKGASVAAIPAYEGLEARYRSAQTLQAQLEALEPQLRKRFGRGLEAGGRAELLDLAHYTDALQFALEGKPEPSPLMIKQAWQYRFCHQMGACQPSTSTASQPVREYSLVLNSRRSEELKEFDPSNGTATPANTSNQRLAQSGRPTEKPDTSNCDQLRRELEEARKLRDAFTNPDLLDQADQKNWDADQYNDEVAKSVFGPNASQGDGYDSPMGTDPATCKIKVNWSREKYREKGYSDISYDADYEHEKSHEQSCRDTDRTQKGKYKADMSFPRKLAAEEAKAYQRKIDFLTDWLNQNCNE